MDKINYYIDNYNYVKIYLKYLFFAYNKAFLSYINSSECLIDKIYLNIYIYFSTVQFPEEITRSIFKPLN